MGKALRTEHIEFFIARMIEHDKVINFELIPDKNEILYKITRRLSRKEATLTVHLADTYRYGLADLHARPKRLSRGSFVMLGLPHASFDKEAIEQAKQHGIGVGHIGKFMGALNYDKIWEYQSPQERQEQARQENAG